MEANAHYYHRGMTLLELLVTMAIFSIIATAGHLALSQGMNIASRLQQQQTQWRALEAAINILEMDLLQALAREPRITGQQSSHAFRGERDATRALDGEFLRFTRGGQVNFLEHSAGPYQRIAYRLEEDRLYRLVWPRLDGPYGMRAQESQVLDGIDNVRLRYLGVRRNWEQNWNTDYNEQTEILPGAIEFDLVLSNGKSYRRLFHVGHAY